MTRLFLSDLAQGMKTGILVAALLLWKTWLLALRYQQHRWLRGRLRKVCLLCRGIRWDTSALFFPTKLLQVGCHWRTKLLWSFLERQSGSRRILIGCWEIEPAIGLENRKVPNFRCICAKITWPQLFERSLESCILLHSDLCHSWGTCRRALSRLETSLVAYPLPPEYWLYRNTHSGKPISSYPI